jgi:hypothetical protein
MMSGHCLTGRKSEILLALPIVSELAEDTLSPSELDEAERISVMLAGSKKQRKDAVYYLMEMVSPPPKRPLYYAQNEMRGLPLYTRDVIRYLGDYIDLLVKAMTFEFVKDQKCKKRSLGANLRALKPTKYKVPSELLDKSSRYNSFLYQPGKHDFSIPPGRSHRFTSREVVLTSFITLKLADDIKKLSQFATQVSLDQVEIQDL